MKAVGSIRFDVGTWSITCQPHVMIRLKRLFERIDKGEHGTATLSATPENSRELAWFMVRYPFEISRDDQRRLNELTSEHVESEALLDRILAAEYEPRAFELATPLRTYQAQAAELALRSGALLVADDVGLGKTATAIGVISDPAARPHLVVTLTHLPRQWVAEIEKFAPGLSVHVLKKGTPYDITRGPRPGESLFPDASLPDVIVSNYHKLNGWADTLAPLVRGVTFDEVQELRREQSLKYKAARHLASRARVCLGLSATPIYNYGSEIYNVLNAMRPGVLGRREEFGREWCSGRWDDKAPIRDPRAFGAYVRSQGLMLRRTRKDVGRELPSLSRMPYEIDCDLGALEDVRVEVERLAGMILDAGLKPFERMKAGGELDYKLRHATGLAKAPYVAAFVRLLIESGERVVLYGWHHDVYACWREQLADLKPAFYTGRESEKRKHEEAQRFIAGDTPVLILSLRSGAGLDGLQHVSRTVVFGELDWSPGVHEQCIGRVHRDGQGEPVAAYFLIAEAGSDPVIADVLQLKRAQSDGLRDPDADLIEKLEVDEHRIRRLAEAYLRRKENAA